MGHLLYLMFRCDFDVMESLERVEKFWDLNAPQDHRFGSSEIKVHFRRKNNRHTHTDRSRESRYYNRLQADEVRCGGESEEEREKSGRSACRRLNGVRCSLLMGPDEALRRLTARSGRGRRRQASHAAGWPAQPLSLLSGSPRSSWSAPAEMAPSVLLVCTLSCPGLSLNCE